MKLVIIIASTRPNRRGKVVADWFIPIAQQHGKFDEVEVADLAEINLPLLDEPEEADSKEYVHQHTKDWSRRIDAADAFVVVTPEYNNTAPASLLNAFDYLYWEWAYKPVAFISYGAIAAGTRGLLNTRIKTTTLQMVPIKPGVFIPFIKTRIGEDGKFQAEERNEKSAVGMLDELHRWAEALQTLR